MSPSLGNVRRKKYEHVYCFCCFIFQVFTNTSKTTYGIQVRRSDLQSLDWLSLSLINKLKRCNTNPGDPSVMLYILSWQTQLSCIYANAAILDNKYLAFKTPGQSNFTKSLHTAHLYIIKWIFSLCHNQSDFVKIPLRNWWNQ